MKLSFAQPEAPSDIAGQEKPPAYFPVAFLINNQIVKSAPTFKRRHL
jgi:hypothetical protein